MTHNTPFAITYIQHMYLCPDCEHDTEAYNAHLLRRLTESFPHARISLVGENAPSIETIVRFQVDRSGHEDFRSKFFCAEEDAVEMVETTIAEIREEWHSAKNRSEKLV